MIAHEASIDGELAVVLSSLEANGAGKLRARGENPSPSTPRLKASLASSPGRMHVAVHSSPVLLLSTLQKHASEPLTLLYMPSSTSLYTVRDHSSPAHPQQSPPYSPLPVLRHPSLPCPTAATCHGYSKTSSSTRMTKRSAHSASRLSTFQTETSDRVPVDTR